MGTHLYLMNFVFHVSVRLVAVCLYHRAKTVMKPPRESEKVFILKCKYCLLNTNTTDECYKQDQVAYTTKRNIVG